jgi:hypothetical protein
MNKAAGLRDVAIPAAAGLAGLGVGGIVGRHIGQAQKPKLTGLAALPKKSQDNIAKIMVGLGMNGPDDLQHLSDWDIAALTAGQQRSAVKTSNPLKAKTMNKASQVYEAGESVNGMKPKVTYESHKECSPGEFGVRVKEALKRASFENTRESLGHAGSAAKLLLPAGTAIGALLGGAGGAMSGRGAVRGALRGGMMGAGASVGAPLGGNLGLGLTQDAVMPDAIRSSDEAGIANSAAGLVGGGLGGALLGGTAYDQLEKAVSGEQKKEKTEKKALDKSLLMALLAGRPRTGKFSVNSSGNHGGIDVRGREHASAAVGTDNQKTSAYEFGKRAASMLSSMGTGAGLGGLAGAAAGLVAPGTEPEYDENGNQIGTQRRSRLSAALRGGLGGAALGAAGGAAVPKIQEFMAARQQAARTQDLKNQQQGALLRSAEGVNARRPMNLPEPAPEPIAFPDAKTAAAREVTAAAKR